MTMSELRWKPYQEFGPPQEVADTIEAPGGPVLIRAVGYLGGRITVYWEAAEMAGAHEGKEKPAGTGRGGDGWKSGGGKGAHEKDEKPAGNGK